MTSRIRQPTRDPLEKDRPTCWNPRRQHFTTASLKKTETPAARPAPHKPLPQWTRPDSATPPRTRNYAYGRTEPRAPAAAAPPSPLEDGRQQLCSRNAAASCRQRSHPHASKLHETAEHESATPRAQTAPAPRPDAIPTHPPPLPLTRACRRG